MSSKPMDNASLVHNEEMEGHQAGQYSMNPPGYSGQQNRTYTGQPAAGYYNPPTAVTNNSHHTIQMNAGPQQPMVIVDTGVEPQTTSSLVMSTLNTIFCFAWPLGLMAIALSWQARLHVLDRKYGHARHTLTVSWIVNGIGFLFGLAVWGLLIWMISLTTRASRYGY